MTRRRRANFYWSGVPKHSTDGRSNTKDFGRPVVPHREIISPVKDNPGRKIHREITWIQTETSRLKHCTGAGHSSSINRRTAESRRLWALVSPYHKALRPVAGNSRRQLLSRGAAN